MPEEAFGSGQLIVVLILLILVIIPYWKIFGKAGFSSWLALLILVPIVNLSCREGSCCVCVCRLVKGRVTMPGDNALEPPDIADGYILACQSLPESDAITVTYDD